MIFLGYSKKKFCRNSLDFESKTLLMTKLSQKFMLSQNLQVNIWWVFDKLDTRTLRRLFAHLFAYSQIVLEYQQKHFSSVQVLIFCYVKLNISSNYFTISIFNFTPQIRFSIFFLSTCHFQPATPVRFDNAVFDFNFGEKIKKICWIFLVFNWNGSFSWK